MAVSEVHSRLPDSLLTYAAARPPEGIGERLREELLRLREVEGFLSAAVTRRDGLAIQHTLGSPRYAASLCAMAAAMVGASRSTGTELDQGVFVHGIIQYDEGILVLRDAGPEAVLACLLRPETNVGLALTTIARISDRVRDALAEL